MVLPRRAGFLILVAMAIVASFSPGAARGRNSPAFDFRADDETNPEVGKLIAQLGDDELAKRKEAESKLVELGEKALPQLRQAAREHLDADVRLRAILLLRNLDVREFQGHTGNIRHVSVSKDGKTALTAAMDGTVRLWELSSGRELKRFGPHKNWAWCAVFSPDGSKMLSSDVFRGVLKLWDLTSGKMLRQYTGHAGRVYAAAFSPDGKYVLSSGAESDLVVRLYETDTGKEVRKFEGHAGWVWRAVFSPDGSKIASIGCNDRSFRIWDVATGKTLVLGTAAHEGHVEGLCFSPDGKTLLTSGRDQSCKLWDVASGKMLRKYVGTERDVECVAISPDGKRFLAGETNQVYVFDLESGNVVQRFEDHSGRVYAVAWLPDGKKAISGGEDNVLKMWGVAQ